MRQTADQLAPDVRHEHEWVLRGVEFEDYGLVTRYACACGQVWFE